jgi:hypothetical protein
MKKKKARNWQPCRVCRHEHQNPASSTLCSLACHKQEVGITMRKPLEIEIGDTVKIAESSQYYQKGTSNPTCEGVVIPPTGEWPYRVLWPDGQTNSYQAGDLTLIKKGKTMQFTKSDLKTGMFVKQRDGDYAIVLDEALSTMRLYTALSNITSSLCHNYIKSSDIMAVYTTASRDTLGCHLSGESLTLIWERTEQTEAQKEMGVLQEQAKALQEQITKLQGTL